MARTTSDERQSEKLEKLDALKAQIAKMEGNATKRFGGSLSEPVLRN